MPRIKAAHLTICKRPFILFGDSNMCGGYHQATSAPSYSQVASLAASWAFDMYCHQGNWPASNAVQDSIVAVAPFATDNPGLRVNWTMDLAYYLSKLGVNPCMLNYSHGGNTLDYYNPNIVGNSYATVLAKLKTWLASLPNHLEPVLVIYEGTNGAGTAANWAAGMTAVMAALRADLGYPHMRVIVCGMPSTWAAAGAAAIISSQHTYVGSDPYSSFVVDDAATFVDNTIPEPLQGQPYPAIHLDLASGARLALLVAQEARRVLLAI